MKDKPKFNIKIHEKLLKNLNHKSSKPENTVKNELQKPKHFKQKRERKNSEQLALLIETFNKNPEWSKETISDLADKTRMKSSQIYKWHWDCTESLKKKVNRAYRLPDVTCRETMSPLDLENSLYVTQKLYKYQISRC